MVSQQAARGGMGHSLSLMEIMLPVNQKFGAGGKSTLEVLETLLEAEANLCV